MNLAAFDTNPLCSIVRPFSKRLKRLRRSVAVATTCGLTMLVGAISANTAQALSGDDLGHTRVSTHSCIATSIANDKYMRRYRTGIKNISPNRTLAVTCPVTENVSTSPSTPTVQCQAVTYRAAAVFSVPTISSAIPEMNFFKQFPVAAPNAETMYSTGKLQGVLQTSTDTANLFEVEGSLDCSQESGENTTDISNYTPILYFFIPPGSTLNLVQYTTQSGN